MTEQLKYPIGKANIPSQITDNYLEGWISIIEHHPEKIAQLVANLTEDQLDTPYRENGWTIRQVVHHLGDSHTNSYIRFKWSLTEFKPIIKAYHEDRWAELQDSKYAPIQISLDYLKALHSKWVYLLKGISKDDLKKCFIHPESNEEVPLDKNIGIYAWHCEHHYQHINQLLIRKGWKN